MGKEKRGDSGTRISLAHLTFEEAVTVVQPTPDSQVGVRQYQQKATLKLPSDQRTSPRPIFRRFRMKSNSLK